MTSRILTVLYPFLFIGKCIGALLLSTDAVRTKKTVDATSSTGMLLQTLGLKVTALKIDPYMNIDVGTMRQEHGEFACTRGLAKLGSNARFLNDGGSTSIWETTSGTSA